MSILVYGIPNCDTVKKARGWLDEAQLAYRFHDFKKAGVPRDRLDAWSRAVGWTALVNRQGTTWRKLDAAAQDRVQDAPSAAELMMAQPSIIKRPVVEWADGTVTVGFDAGAWAARRAG